MNLNNMKTVGQAFSELQDLVLSCGVRGLKKATQTGGLFVEIDRGRGLRATVTVCEGKCSRVTQGALEAMVYSFVVTVWVDGQQASPALAVAQAQLHTEAAQFACLLEALTDAWTVGSITEGERGR